MVEEVFSINVEGGGMKFTATFLKNGDCVISSTSERQIYECEIASNGYLRNFGIKNADGSVNSFSSFKFEGDKVIIHHKETRSATGITDVRDIEGYNRMLEVSMYSDLRQQALSQMPVELRQKLGF